MRKCKVVRWRRNKSKSAYENQSDRTGEPRIHLPFTCLWQGWNEEPWSCPLPYTPNVISACLEWPLFPLQGQPEWCRDNQNGDRITWDPFFPRGEPVVSQKLSERKWLSKHSDEEFFYIFYFPIQIKQPWVWFKSSSLAARCGGWGERGFRMQMSHMNIKKTLGRCRLYLPSSPPPRAHANELASLKITASVLLAIKALHNYRLFTLNDNSARVGTAIFTLEW